MMMFFTLDRRRDTGVSRGCWSLIVDEVLPG